MKSSVASLSSSTELLIHYSVIEINAKKFFAQKKNDYVDYSKKHTFIAKNNRFSISYFVAWIWIQKISMRGDLIFKNP